MSAYVLTAAAQENIRNWLISELADTPARELVMLGDEPCLDWWFTQAEDFQHLEIPARNSRIGVPVTYTLSVEDFEVTA